ncbi:MAG: hypothetical protein ACKO3B_04115, partial [Bacteroidota bacterium]
VILNEKILPGITTTFTPSTNCIPLTIDGKLRDGNGVITPTITQATTFTSIWHNADTPTSPIDPLANETANQPVLKYVTGGPTAFYTLEIINDENGCRNTATVLLPDGKARPVITLAKSDNDICDPSLATNAPGVDFSGAITLTITPPVNPDPLAYNYAWSSAADPTFAKTTKDLVGLPSALYTVEVTDIETGCTSVPVSAQVLDKTTLPSLSSSFVASTNCASPVTVGTNTNAAGNGEASVTIVSGAANFAVKWSDKNGPINDLLNPTSDELNLQFIKGTASVTDLYTATVTNTDNGCQNTAAVLVPENKVIPQFEIVPVSNGICDPVIAGKAFNGKATANVTAPSTTVSDYTFTWTGATPSDPLKPNELFDIGPGTYTVKVKAISTACETQPVSFDILDEPILPNVTKITPVASTNCVAGKENGSITVDEIDGSTNLAAYTFVWHNAASAVSPIDKDNNGIPDETNAVLANVQGGSTQFYTVVVTNTADGCQNTASTRLIDAKVLPVVQVTQLQPNTICDDTKAAPVGAPRSFDGSLGADVTTVSFPGETDTDYDYDWTVPDGSIVKTGDVDVLTARKDGAYSVVATSQLTGCSSAPVAGTITAPVLPVPVVDTQASTNCTGGTKNGEVFVTLPFQDPLVYAYSWFDGATATGAVKSTADRYTG